MIVQIFWRLLAVNVIPSRVGHPKSIWKKPQNIFYVFIQIIQDLLELWKFFVNFLLIFVTCTTTLAVRKQPWENLEKNSYVHKNLENLEFLEKILEKNLYSIFNPTASKACNIISVSKTDFC